MTQHIYIISTIKDGKQCAPIKIGRAKSPLERLRAVQTGSPYPVAISCSFPMPSKEFASELEGICHSMAQEKRMVGEWFDMHPHEATQLIVLMIGAAFWEIYKNNFEVFAALLDCGIYEGLGSAKHNWPERPIVNVSPSWVNNIRGNA